VSGGVQESYGLAAVAMYGFTNVVYLASFYCTMFRTKIVVDGVDLFATLRESLVWHRYAIELQRHALERMENVAVARLLCDRAICRIDSHVHRKRNGQVEAVAILNTRRYLHVYIACFLMCIGLSLGITIWFFVVDVGTLKDHGTGATWAVGTFLARSIVDCTRLLIHTLLQPSCSL
jgi:hypothetical protein